MDQSLTFDSAGATAGERMLALIRAKFPGYHPILAIAEMAHSTEIHDERLKFDCHKTIVKYVTPELKSIEVKAEIKDSRRVIVSMFQEGDITDAEVVEQRALPQDAPAKSDALQEQLLNVLAGAEELTA